MLGFKKFKNASVTITGIELIHKTGKGQFDTSGLEENKMQVSQIWETALAV
jgi:putative transposase